MSDMAPLSMFLQANVREFADLLDRVAASIAHFGTEFQVVAAALAILILDLFLPRRSSKHLAWVALIACVVPVFGPLDRLSQHLLTDLEPYAEGNLFLGMVSLDPFADFYKVFFLLGSIPVIFLTYLSEELRGRRMGEYYAILLAAVFGAMLMASSTHFLMLFMSLELLSICSYVLVCYKRRDQRSAEAALKYIIYGSVAAAVMLFGISLYFGLTGSADLSALGEVVRGEGAGGADSRLIAVTVLVSLLLIFVGIAYKIASIPMHFWAPDAYEGAPTPVTAFLSVSSKAAGFALGLRFFQSLNDAVQSLPPGASSEPVWNVAGVPALPAGATGVSPWIALLVLISILTMTLGNLAALWQTNLKRLFAYSSIAHAGYMMMGFTILHGSEVGGIEAVSFYLLAYLAMNFGAFAVVILVENRLGSVNLDDYRGLSKRAPFLSAALVVFLFSLIGVPPTAGFTAKWQLFMGVLDMGRPEHYLLAIAAAINTAISAYYYLKIAREMYLADAPEGTRVTAPLLGRLVVAAMVIMTFYLFFMAQGVLDTAKELDLRV